MSPAETGNYSLGASTALTDHQPTAMQTRIIAESTATKIVGCAERIERDRLAELLFELVFIFIP
jgi:hypothetical protein